MTPTSLPQADGLTNELPVVFQEIADVLKADSPVEVARLKPKSMAAREFALHLLAGHSATEALFLVCQNQATLLGQRLFGCASTTYHADSDQLIVSERQRRLHVLLAPLVKREDLGYKITPNAVLLETDFASFKLTRSDSAGRLSQPFGIFDREEVANDITLTGSLWEIFSPTHYANVSRTISYTFSKHTEGALFTQPRPPFDENQVERAALDQLACLDTLSTHILTLDSLAAAMQTSLKAPTRVSEHKEGSYTLRRYSPQRSALFNFGEPASVLTRGDFVTTYNVGDQEFHREFASLPHGLLDRETELLSATFDLLHTLAIRRTKLFRAAFARRVYNILLPAVLLQDCSDEQVGYAIFPCLNLYRTPRHGFRRTLSLTFLACPAVAATSGDTITDLSSRCASLDELYGLKNALLSQFVTAASGKSPRYVVSGPGRGYFELPRQCSIDELLQQASTMVLKRILGRRRQGDINTLITETLFAANQESRLATMLLLVDWKSPPGYTQPWERWLATGEDTVFRNTLFRTLFYADYLDPSSADASRHAIQFDRFNIGNSEGADIGGMTLYNPHESLKVVLYPRSREKYPDYSLIRWTAWQIYIDSALTALRALIFKFHPILEDRGYLQSLIYALDEMVQEFIDFYDLDLRDLLYRQEYEKIRRLMQIDADHAQLMEKFNSAKVDESLREQRLINKLVVSLTVATVTITVMSTLAQVGALSVPWYLAIALPASVGLVLFGYHVFDPVRLAYTRLTSTLSRLWN